MLNNYKNCSTAKCHKKNQQNKQDEKPTATFYFVCVYQSQHSLFTLALSLYLIFIPYYTHTHDLMNTFIPNHWFSYSSFLFFFKFVFYWFWSIWTIVDNVVIRGWVTWPDAIFWLILAIRCRVSRASPCLYASTVTPVFSLLWLFFVWLLLKAKILLFF